MTPLNINKNPGSPISSNNIVWQGPNLPCISLCKGDTVTDVIYKLANKLCAIADELNISNFDLECLALEGCLPKTFQELIQLLITLICELRNEPGTAGANGTPGNYVEIFYEAPGANCENGGTRIELHNGVTTALISTQYVCNGADGDDGDPGNQGPPGASITGATGSTGLPGASGSDATIIVQDEGVDLTTSNTINFTGEGVTATHIAGVNTVDVPYGLDTFYCLTVIDTPYLDTTNQLFPRVPVSGTAPHGLGKAKTVKKYQHIYSNGVVASAIGTFVLNVNVPPCSFGVFDNENEGEFMITKTGHYLMQGSCHLKANDSGDQFWQPSGTGAFGIAFRTQAATPNNIYGGDYTTTIPGIHQAVDMTSSITAYLTAGSIIRMGLLNVTGIDYDGTGYDAADAIRFSITKLK